MLPTTLVAGGLRDIDVVRIILMARDLVIVDIEACTFDAVFDVGYLNGYFHRYLRRVRCVRRCAASRCFPPYRRSIFSGPVRLTLQKVGGEWNFEIVGRWTTTFDYVVLFTQGRRARDEALNIERSQLNKQLTRGLTRAYARALTRVYVYAHGSVAN